MKPILTITFNTFEDYKNIRDGIEESKLNPSWKYGASDGTNFIQFFNGTKAEFFLRLGATLQKENITGYQLS